VKTNKELMEWVDKKKFTFSHPDIRGKFIYVQDVGKLFTGMKLVPDDSIVLSREHADTLAWPVGLPYKDVERAQTALKEAIQEAEGAEKDD
jgi:hypothetical protein